jgi:hypothetical protein
MSRVLIEIKAKDFTMSLFIIRFDYGRKKVAAQRDSLRRWEGRSV